MTTSSSWTLFEIDGVPATPVAGRPGLTGRALVDNSDPGGSTLLAVQYEPGAGDDARRHAVGQVILVIDGELTINGHRCGPGAGCYAPPGLSYSILAGPDGATAVEFRPAPIVYTTGVDDEASAPVKPPTSPDPAYAWDIMQSAGPMTSCYELSYFDIETMPEARVSDEMTIQALVNHREPEGQSMLMVHHGPNNYTATHSHDVDQIVVVLHGSISQGNRTFTSGTGFFTPRGKKYNLRAGVDGTVRVEWRPSPLQFSTDWAEPLAGV